VEAGCSVRNSTDGPGAGGDQGTDPDLLDAVCLLVADTLGLGSRKLGPDTPLLGQMVEFDSMAVVAIITALEDRYGIRVEDEELTASIFEDVASLARFVAAKCRP